MSLLHSTAPRLNIYDDQVIKKAEEYLRLYQSKPAIKTLNDQAKLILCLDLAARFLDKNIDKETALSLSGFRKSAYQNHLNTLEKLLGLDKKLSVADVCVQLGCMSIKDDAEAILSQYRALDKVDNVEHPQYVAAATYLACKAKKVPLDKQKVVSLSRLRQSQWNELLSNFQKLGVGKRVIKEKQQKTVESEDCNGEEEKTGSQECGSQDEVTADVEDYEVWKRRILETAYAALREQNKVVDLMEE